MESVDIRDAVLKGGGKLMRNHGFLLKHSFKVRDAKPLIEVGAR